MTILKSSKSLKDVILEAREYTNSMESSNAERVFCVTRGAAIAKQKNNKTNGYDCWLELVAYWDKVTHKGRLKFIPLLSGYQFGDTTLPDKYLEQLCNSEIQYGSDTVFFTAENQPPKLKLSPSAIKQLCAVEGATHHQTLAHWLGFIKPNQLILRSHDGQLFRNVAPPAFPGPDSALEKWNQFSLGYGSILEWQKSEEDANNISAKLFDEAPFHLVPTIWLPTPNKSLLTLAEPKWGHEHYEYTATNRSDRFRLDYVKSSTKPDNHIWNYVIIDKFNPLH